MIARSSGELPCFVIRQVAWSLPCHSRASHLATDLLAEHHPHHWQRCRKSLNGVMPLPTLSMQSSTATIQGRQSGLRQMKRSRFHFAMSFDE